MEDSTTQQPIRRRDLWRKQRIASMENVREMGMFDAPLEEPEETITESFLTQMEQQSNQNSRRSNKSSEKQNNQHNSISETAMKGLMDM